MSPPRQDARQGKTAYELTEWGETDPFLLLRQSLANVTSSTLRNRAAQLAWKTVASVFLTLSSWHS